MATAWNLNQLGHSIAAFEQRASFRSGEGEHVIQRGDFCIDLQARKVSVRDEEIRLDQDEFEILLFLMEHRTNIITPHTRLSTRWTREKTHHSDFLRILARLQKKLEGLHGGGEYIRTEPWVICRFDPGR